MQQRQEAYVLSSRAASLVALVCQEPKGLRQVRKNVELAKKVLQEIIANHNFSPASLVTRANHDKPKFKDALYGVLIEHYKNRDDVVDFLLAVADATQDSVHSTWHLDFNIEPFRPLLSDAKIVKGLLERDGKNLLYCHHPFHDYMDTNRYWKQRVHWYLVKKDWIRTWEELKKAAKGFPNPLPTPRSLIGKDERGLLSASTATIKELVIELYEAMRKDELIPVVPEGHFRVAEVDTLVDSPVYGTKKAPNNRRPVERRQDRPLAGLWIASDRFLFEFHERSCILTREGGMILAIAHYHRLNKNTKRRQRHEQLLKEHKSNT